MADRDILLENPSSLCSRELEEIGLGNYLEGTFDEIRSVCQSESEIIFFSAVVVAHLRMGPAVQSNQEVAVDFVTLDDDHQTVLRGDEAFERWRSEKDSPWSYGWLHWRGFLQRSLGIGGDSCRVDCEFRTIDDSFQPIVVEIDGYKWHSDRDSFVRDRARSRTLTMGGATVLRYAGSEVWKDPLHHAEGLVSYLRGLSLGPVGTRKDLESRERIARMMDER